MSLLQPCAVSGADALSAALPSSLDGTVRYSIFLLITLLGFAFMLYMKRFRWTIRNVESRAVQNSFLRYWQVHTCPKDGHFYYGVEHHDFEPIDTVRNVVLLVLSSTAVYYACNFSSKVAEPLLLVPYILSMVIFTVITELRSLKFSFSPGAVSRMNCFAWVFLLSLAVLLLGAFGLQLEYVVRCDPAPVAYALKVVGVPILVMSLYFFARYKYARERRAPPPEAPINEVTKRHAPPPPRPYTKITYHWHHFFIGAYLCMVFDANCALSQWVSVITYGIYIQGIGVYGFAPLFFTHQCHPAAPLHSPKPPST